MKASNITNTFIDKQNKKLRIYSIISYIIIYILLGIIVIILFDNIFFQRAKRTIKSARDFNVNGLLTTDDGIYLRSTHDRVLFIFYDENKDVISNGYSLTLLDYIYRKGNEYSIEEKEEAKKYSIFKLNETLDKVNQYEILNARNTSFYFITLSFKLNEKTNNVSYVKLLIMMNADRSLAQTSLVIYLIASSFVLSFGVIASIIMSRIAIKPITDAYNFENELINDSTHELKTPLAIINSKLENILTKSDKKVIDVSEDIAISLEQINRLNSLVQNLVRLANSDINQQYYNFEECDIKELVNDVASVFEEMAVLSNKKFTLALDDVTGYIDKEKMTQVIIILLDNALKYTQEKDEIFVKLSKINTDFSLEVMDTGIGISKEHQAKIYDRFFRDDRAKLSGISGHGIGLSIAYAIIKNHKGKIEFRDNNPKGSIFKVTISCKEKSN